MVCTLGEHRYTVQLESEGSSGSVLLPNQLDVTQPGMDGRLSDRFLPAHHDELGPEMVHRRFSQPPAPPQLRLGDHRRHLHNVSSRFQSNRTNPTQFAGG
ncbi:hypothetical protein D3C80_1843860 [compost metagenome]